MTFIPSRRALLQLMSVGGVVFASGLPREARARSKSRPQDSDFFFLQLSDTHWGYDGPSNPRAPEVLPQVIQTVNASAAKPDFVVFTGDLSHNTDDPAVRRKRLREFKDLSSRLDCKVLHFLPGEHDAAADQGAAYKESFGPTYYSFDHKGVHFIALDNVSDKRGALGPTQRDWLAADLKKQSRHARIMVLTHRPLFDLAAAWEWTTEDGANVIDMLLPYPQVSVFYGHIHQEHHHQTEHIAHHAARSLVFALPAPLSVPKKAPLPWDAAHPRRGLGYRAIEEAAAWPPILKEQLLEPSTTEPEQPGNPAAQGTTGAVPAAAIPIAAAPALATPAPAHPGK